MLDDKTLKQKLDLIRAAGGEVPDDIEQRLNAGEIVSVSVRGDGAREALAHGFDLEGTGNAVIAIACDTTDDPADVAKRLEGPELRLLAIRDPWPRERQADRTEWCVQFLRAGGGFSLGLTSSGMEEAARDGVQLMGLAEVLNATGALSHTFQCGPKLDCPCGCGEIIEADDKLIESNVDQLARLHIMVLDHMTHAKEAPPPEPVDIAGLYVVLQRRVMIPQTVPVYVAGGEAVADDDEIRSFVGHELLMRVFNGGGTWLMFSASPLEQGFAEASVVDLAVPGFTKADPLARPVVDMAVRLVHAGMLTALDHDVCLPRAKTFSAGADRLVLLGVVPFDKMPDNLGDGLAMKTESGNKAIVQAARFAEVRYRGRAILAAASLAETQAAADAALANKGPRTFRETASLAIMRAAGLLTVLGEVDSGSHMHRGAAQGFLRADPPAFGEGLFELGRYGLGNNGRLFPSAIMRYAIGATLAARKGIEAASKVVNDTQNACAVMAQGLVAQVKAGDIDGAQYLERSEQAACDMWWNAWHGQFAN